ncbi:mads-box protein jointless [Fagus crenata]
MARYLTIFLLSSLLVTHHEDIPAQVEEDIVKVEPSMGFPEKDHSVADPVESRSKTFNATDPIAAESIAAELALFMEKFEKVEYNSQPREHFWIWTVSLNEFIQFKVPSEGLPLLIHLKERYGNFTAGFQFGATTGSFMLSMLCAVLLDMQNSFVGNIDEVRLLEWRGVVRELMKAGFAVGFILDHLRHMARAVFSQIAKGVFENLNTQIADLKKTFTELEFRRDHLVARGLAPTILSVETRISDGLFD